MSATIVGRILDEAPHLEVEVVAVEADPAVVGFLRATLDDCQSAALAAGTRATTHLLEGDYIDLSTGLAGNQGPLADPFDLVIMNPPYRKLPANSPVRTALRAIGVDCPNLYAAFLALGAHALGIGGQLVAITPRSFMNGPYFEEFRKHLLTRVALDRIHSFKSRSTVFADTGVLQESVILRAVRGGSRTAVDLATSTGADDIAVSESIPYDAVVDPNDPHMFIRLAAEGDRRVAAVMKSMPSTLVDLGLEVSTGRVVDFRCRSVLLAQPTGGSAPLVYPGNVRNGLVEWPREIRKPQALDTSDEQATAKLLMPAGCYVVVKRFSSKEERRRVVAGVWDDLRAPAFENHINVFHHRGGGLDKDLAVGLSFWLNSSVVDQCFRTFSGHTQVNATDLRALRYPAVDRLRLLGASRPVELPDQARIDATVAENLLP